MAATIGFGEVSIAISTSWRPRGWRGFVHSAEGGAVNGGNDRLRRVLHRDQHLVETRRLRRLAEFGDVGAGDKGAAAAGQNDRLHLRIGDRALDAFENTAP